MKNSFKVSYVTTLPKEGNAPRVTITGSEKETYGVFFHEIVDEGFKLVSSGTCKTNQTIVSSEKQWYTEWAIMIKDSKGETVFTDVFNPQGKTIFIKMDAHALGDSIAWMPYVEVFRKKHNCRVICSTFHNKLFVEAYPDIIFAKPNTVLENIYAQYYVGAANDGNLRYSPIKVNENPLQAVAYRILGLRPMEIRPDLTIKYQHIPRRLTQKYVTISEFGSSPIKEWKANGGWQGVVNYLASRGYAVLAISKEPSSLNNVINLTGDVSLDERAVDIMHAEFHIGVSSGLSWLAWALGTPVVMISDVTPKFHEFSSNITRIGGDDLFSVNYLSETQTPLEKVLEILEESKVS